MLLMLGVYVNIQLLKKILNIKDNLFFICENISGLW